MFVELNLQKNDRQLSFYQMQKHDDERETQKPPSPDRHVFTNVVQLDLTGDQRGNERQQIEPIILRPMLPM